MAELDARLSCSTETRDRIRALKTDDQRRYEDVLRRLVDEYDREND